MNIKSTFSTSPVPEKIVPNPGETITFTADNYATIEVGVDDDGDFTIGGYYFDAEACDEAADFFKLLAKIARGEATTEDLEV